jgi:hypothetical protein
MVGENGNGEWKMESSCKMEREISLLFPVINSSCDMGLELGLIVSINIRYGIT